MSNSALGEVADRIAITEKLNEYARAMDRMDDELGYGVFHPEAKADYGEMFQGSGHEFIDFARQAHQGMLVHQHAISNISIHLDGDNAGSESYVTVTFRMRDQDGSLRGMRVHGRYIDRWQRRDGQWRISERRYIQEMDDSWLVDSQYDAGGKRDSSDPSYEVL